MRQLPRGNPRSHLRLAVTLGLMAATGCTGGARTSSASSSTAALPLAPLAASSERFEGDFGKRLSGADPRRRFVALVDLTEQLDLRAYGQRLRRSGGTKETRRAAVVEALERVAARQQARLRPLLDRLVAEGSAGFVQPVAIVNRLVVEGTPAALLTLAASPEVALVRPDWTSDRAATRTDGGSQEVAIPLGDAFRSWAPDQMRAERLWSQGFDGRGVLVATIDTGAFEAHEQLEGRRLPGERGWFDPVEGTTVGTDQHGHGTGVLSQAVGGNPDHRVVGIAPAASWTAALGNWHNYYSRSRMTLAADWMLRTARPDVLVNAWSHDEGVCSEFDRPFIDAWKASGIFVVFPVGNAGPGDATGESPAQLAGVFPDGGPVFSVGGLRRSGDVDPLSSRGPSRCGSQAFPSLAAPGSDLPMAALGGPRSYVVGRGTSLSAGLLGGGAALLLQAVPEAEPEAVERALILSARDVPPAGRDEASGAGAVDLEEALMRLVREPRR